MTRSSQLYLKAFGTVVVTDQKGELLVAVMTQPTRCAVLAFLTIESVSGFQSRDKLAAMFWPDSDAAKSRRSLNQLVYSLRQQLGADIIDKRGEDQLGMNLDLIGCDVVEFIRGVERGDLGRSLDLYQGDLLDGLYLSKAPEFERWVDTKRAEYRAEAARAAWKLADQYRSDGDLIEAGRYACRAAAFIPHDEAAMQRLLQFLDAIGQRTTAIQAYRKFEARMMADLEIAPSPETRALVETIRDREALHHTFTPPAIRVPTPVAVVPSIQVTAESNAMSTSAEQSGTRPAPHRLTARWLAVATAGIMAAILAVALAVHGRGTSRSPTAGADPRHIAVLFFDDLTPDQSLGWLVRGLTVDLIHDLSALDTLHVVSAPGVQQFRNINLPVDSVARALHVGTLIDGSVRRINDRLEVTVELIDATSAYKVDSRRFEQPSREVFKLKSDILFGINRFLRERIGRSMETFQRRELAHDVDAWRMMQQGEELMESGIALGRFGSSVRAWATLTVADSLFEAAGRLEPQWVDPLIMQARIARAEYLSLTLTDPVPGQPSGSAGMIQLARGRIDEGLRLVARALKIVPGHAEASTLEGYFLFSRWFVDGQAIPSRDLDAAEERLRRVVDRHGDQALAWVILSRANQARGRLADADLAAQRAFAADPFLWEGRRAVADLIEYHLERGRLADASQLCEATRSTYLDDREIVECRLMILGWSSSHRDSVAAAWRELRSIEAVGLPGFATGWTMRRMYVAAVAARSGMTDSAAAIVARAYAGRASNRADSTSAAFAEAWVDLLSRRRVEALHVIDSVLQADASQRDRIATHPWFGSLRDDTMFVRLTSPRDSTER